MLLSRSEIEPLLGPLRSSKDWHRLTERLSRYRRRGDETGVLLSVQRRNEEIAVGAPSPAALSAFCQGLAAGPGYVQRALASGIARKLTDLTSEESWPAFYECQCDEFCRAMPGPFQRLDPDGRLMKRVFVSPPYHWKDVGPGKGAARDAIWSELLGRGGGSVMLLGPPGIGKSRLLLETFRHKPNRLGETAPHPILLSAARMNFSGQDMACIWSDALGLRGSLGERLDHLFRQGRMTLFLDGLDENPVLMDKANPTAALFWQLASRNRCLLSCRSRFYASEFLDSFAHRLFAGRIRSIELLPWSAAHVSALYQSIEARQPGPPLDSVKVLGRLPLRDLQQRLARLRLGGLVAWAYGVFFAAENNVRFPGSEYEILRYLTRLLLSWEAGKGSHHLGVDLAEGLLSRLALQSYASSHFGRAMRISAREVLGVISEHYPQLAESPSYAHSCLSQMPFLRYEGQSGEFEMDSVFGCLLVASHLVELALRHDVEALERAFRTPFGQDVSELLFQAIDTLKPREKLRYFEASRRAFDGARRRYGARPASVHALSMQGLLQPLGRLGLEEARHFVRRVMDDPSVPERAILSCGRALALLGDQQAVARYLNRLRANRKARNLNRNFYLYWLRDGEPAAAEPEPLAELRVEGWNRTCRWLLDQLTQARQRPFREIHLFTFLDLVGRYGLPEVGTVPFQRAADQVAGEMRDGPKSLRRAAKGFLELIRVSTRKQALH